MSDNRRIDDFATLEEAQDDDLLLVMSEDETYNMKVKTFKEAVQGFAERAEAAAKASQAASEEAVTNATQAMTDAHQAMQDAAGALASNEAAQRAAESAAASAQVSENKSIEAVQTAAAAKSAADSALDTADGMDGRLTEVERKVADVSIDPDDLGLEQDADTGLVYPTYRGVRSENGIPLAATGGGGGGGGGLTYTITLKNALPSRTLTVADGQPAVLEFTYTSVDDEGYDDGSGVGTVTVDGLKVKTFTATQGFIAVDIVSHLSPGEHTVKVRVENSEGSTRSLSYTVTLAALSMSTTLDALATYSGPATFYYTPVGVGTKTIHFIMDGEEIGTEEVIGSGKSRTFIIPAQSHGGHIFEAYAEMAVNDVTVKSNTITLGMLWVDSNNADAAIVSPFAMEKATQGETLNIEYLVYDPTTELATVNLAIFTNDGERYSYKTIQVDRSPQVWTVSDYPAGEVYFILLARDGKFCVKVVKVEESTIVIEPITDSLVLNFDAQGRSNQEENPAVWSDGTTTATFTNVSFAGSDGWLTDEKGSPMLRLLPGSEMHLPFKLFETDRRDSGATIEVEMSTNNVRDYDSVVMSCLSGGRGFKIASQYAQLNSEASEVSMQFREEQRVRVSFVIGPKNLKRMIYVFVDGVMCGAIQYPEDDDFSQNPAAGITIGAESSGIDIYRIALYTKGLTRHEILTNYDADRPTLSERMDSHKRNDVLDVSDEIVITKLPASLPYMVISCAELPQFKGNKKTCEITYVDPQNSNKSFTAANVEIDVQGTSSAGYKKKNFLISMLSGLTMTADGSTAEKYALSSKSIPVNVFCLKADVASSDNANNVELVRLYNDTCPYRHNAMKADPRVRYGIEGYPIVVFWQNTVTGETKFWGKYNFNNDKSTPEVFGFGAGYECWEIKNNTSNRVTFHKSDYGDGVTDDFEAVYPKKFTDYAHLKALTDWLVTTDRDAVSTAAAKTVRLNKFRNEFEDHFVKDATLFYYLFTETFLMVDNRAKNFFPTYDPTIDRWWPFPYDMDTALGINNEGQLVFDYDLEDTDKVGGHNVYNGHDSVLWSNVRDAFAAELAAMYVELRNTTDAAGVTPFSYESVFERFTNHQQVWPEAVWNEDAYEKYLRPLFDENDASYLTMLQGDKASQRDWWSYNGFRYRDSKYKAGDANTNFITLRCYNVGDITVTPYSHIWPRIKYGSYTVTERGKRNVATTLKNPLAKMDDTETYIYSADRLADIGDLSPLQVGYADFTPARKLQRLKLGDSAATYQNTKLTELYVGNNDLLTELDVQNCIGLTQSVDLSGCDGLEVVKAKGSSVKGFTLPVGGHIKRLELPATVANFTIRNQKLFESVTFEGYGALTTLRVENTPNVPVETIVSSAGALNRVRLVDVEWQAASETTLAATVARLKGCIGMDAAGNNTDKAVVSGRVHVPSISMELLTEINDNFPELVVVENGVAKYLVRYLNYDATVLYKYVATEGATAIDPVAATYITAPTREATVYATYQYDGWGTLPTNIHSNITLVAQYIVNVIPYTVRFYNGTTLLQTVDGLEYGTKAQYTGETPVKTGVTNVEDYLFTGWSPEPVANGNVDCYAVFQFIGSFARALVERTLSGEYVNDRVNVVGFYAFMGTTKLTSVSFPEVTDVKDSAFQECSGITDIDFPKAVTIRGNAFYKCTSLERVYLPSVVDIGCTGLYAFSTCQKLTRVDLPVVETIYNASFNGCSNLDTFIIRNTAKVCTLGNANALGNTPIEKGTGYIYVPTALYDSYKADSVWRTYTNQFRKLEEWTVDGTVTGELDLENRHMVRFFDGDTFVGYDVVSTGKNAVYPGGTPVKTGVDDPGAFTFIGWEPSNNNITADTDCYAQWKSAEIIDSWDEIIAAVNDGTYVTKYDVGMYKPLDVGTYGRVKMQIVGMNQDTLSDGSGTAAISWLSRELLTDSIKMSSGSEWETSMLRSHLSGTVKSAIASNVVSAIKLVDKNQGHNGTESTVSDNDLWLPSCKELSGFIAGVDETRCHTYDYYAQLEMNSNESDARIKCDVSGTAQQYATRTSYVVNSDTSKTGIWYVTKNGSFKGGSVDAYVARAFYFPIGFCI